MSRFLDNFSSIRAYRDALDAGQFSVTDATKALLADIERHQVLNAFVDVDAARSQEQAVQAEQQLAKGDAHQLAGVPLAHKDIFVTEGWRTTAGSRMLADYVSPFDATVVKRLNDAGTVSLGKASCDEFAMGSGNEHAASGPVLNPWDHRVVPGGSSGGSAAAWLHALCSAPPAPTPAARSGSQLRFVGFVASSQLMGWPRVLE